MPVNRIPLHGQVRDWILQQIGGGDFLPGQRVMEEHVATKLQVSAIPVREAIRELVAMNVLESAPNKGAWVRQVSVAETIEALQLRSVIEPLAVRLAGGSLKQHCPKLRRLASSIVRSAQKRDFKAYQKHNQQFHRSIAAAARSSVLLRMWDSLTFEVSARSVIDSIPHADPIDIGKEHLHIVDSLESGDSDRACALLGAHSLGLIDYLRREEQLLSKPRSGKRKRRAVGMGEGVAAGRGCR
jgi:DNA-binding GntR family transcriptional regulator